jgi:DNA replication and repair protein RecF
LTSLVLANVRNYGALEFTPEPGLNVLLGPNGQGKTNLLEAIGMLGIGKSFRTAHERELITMGMVSASIAGTARVRAGDVRLSCTITASGAGMQKHYGVNGQSVRYASYLGRARVVTFSPRDVGLAAGPPAGRRAMLNAALSQIDPAYYAALARYNRALQQKSALLHGTVAPDRDLLATYDGRLVEHGAVLMLARHRHLATLGEAATQLYRAWSAPRPDEPLAVRYLPNVPFEIPVEADVAAAFAAELARRSAAEVARRVCLVGPHRDDVGLTLGGRALAAYGSQGQQRSAALALRVAEYGVLRDRGGEAPLLLLDDVLSELDRERQRDVLRSIESADQAFLTTTALPEGCRLRTYRINAAVLEAVA